jgi:hypothetical protein
MNATERASLYTKFVVFILLFIIVIMLIPTIKELVDENRPKIPLENRTCEEVYNLTQHDKLYMNDKKSRYTTEQIILYYLEHCQS